MRDSVMYSQRDNRIYILCKKGIMVNENIYIYFDSITKQLRWFMKNRHDLVYLGAV